MEKWVVGFIFLGLIALLIQNRIRPAILFSTTTLFFYLFDFVTFKEITLSFTNSSLVILMLLLTISVAVEKTSFVTEISKRIFTDSYTQSFFRLTFSTAFLSAILNNTAVVATLMNAVKNNKKHLPSKLLIPLSYASIFGGTMTLVGTSTNLIVNSFAIEAGVTDIKIYDFFYVGIFITIFGIVTLFLVSRFLPEIEESEVVQEEYFIETKLDKDSSIVGKKVHESGLRHLEYLFLSEIQRKEKLISPVSPEEILERDDILIFSGDIKHIEILKKIDGLKLTNEKLDLKSNLVEVIISHESNLKGVKVKESNFRSKFDAAIISIKREKEDIKEIGNTILQEGDKLILAIGKEFKLRDNISKNFYILSDIEIEKKFIKKDNFLVFGGFLAVLFLSVTNILPLLKGLLLFTAFLLFKNLLSFSEIKRRFHYEVYLIVGSALVLAKVLMSSGIANEISQIITTSFGHFGVYGSFIAIFLITVCLTEVITNNAAAALIFPIGYATALSLDASIYPFIFAVAYGASASFLSPYSYQTNLMVKNLGGYSFKDFSKIGVFITTIYSLSVLILVPIFFPF